MRYLIILLTFFGVFSIVNDEIQSATALGRLAYTMPAVTDILGGVPMDVFSTHYVSNNNENLEFILSVDNTADATTAACSDANAYRCLIKYSLRYTPLLHDVTPSQVYLDQQINFLINPQAANDNKVITDDYDPVQFIKLSGTRTDSEGLIDYEVRLAQYDVGVLTTLAGD